ncbi:hypothetical protein CDEST_11621 [Colletotrichum destructivum]|uniref:Uncharacterized protein n=1 Tax=Colletotrichum destructivum TaxID=34406 RepID=A0AAX4ITP4_9PEZI|nr:hypothetical protein CDEST_11621 [Colletotrichum destructivum]
MIDIAKKVVSASTGPLVNTELRNATDPQLSAKSKYPGAFSWPSRFFEVRQDNFPKDWENLPFTAALGIETQELEENDISRLVWTEENWAPDQHRVDCLLGITQASEATIQKLIDRDESVHQHKIALLIDGNDSGPDSRLREFFGGLSPQALFDELRRRRYREDEEDDIIDANRRLIYVTDLDAWGIVALIGTSPESLFLVLGDFLYNFICGSSSLGVSFSTQGPETFAMQFSFPYRAWRSTEQLMMDGRINKSTGKAVRSSRDVTFLRRLAKFEEDRENIDCIYTTNISCMVTGYDQSRWTGLVLLETWFEEAGDDPSPDMVARYENDFEDGMLLDPLCRGKYDAIKGVWSPRPYFIRILEIRIVQVHREWAALFSHLQDRMNALITRHKECIEGVQNLALSRESTMSARRNLKELDELEKGINNIKEIWADLAQDLQETVRCGDLFMKTDVFYFRNHDEPSDDASTCFPHLTQIRQTFNNLEQLRQKLDDMKKKCREMVEDIASASKMYRRQLKQVQPGTSGGPSAVVEEYNWPTQFRSHQSFSHTWENTAFVEAVWYHARQVVADPAEKEWLESVLNTEDNWAPDKLPAEVVFDILGGATLNQLRDGNDKIPGSKTAILIDDNSPKTRSGFRHLLGGLSAKELFDELLKKRSSDSQMSPDEKDVFVVSERRLLYITDLSSWTILALLGSATESFLRPVTNLMINYLTSATSIGVSFSTEGPHTFTLEFSFPFRVWRTTEHRKRDPRFKESNGKPLRPSRDVTFLRALADDRREATSIDVVYSTHVSCVVTGFDQRKWTGVMLAETWFEADSTM